MSFIRLPSIRAIRPRASRWLSTATHHSHQPALKETAASTTAFDASSLPIIVKRNPVPDHQQHLSPYHHHDYQQIPKEPKEPKESISKRSFAETAADISLAKVRNDWTKQDITAIYNSPLIDLLYHGVSNDHLTI
jgi:hypothetical protein